MEARQAALQSTIEQTLFDAERAARTSQLAFEDAQRRWEIATGRVTTLLGLAATAVSIAELPDGQERALEAVDLSMIQLRATRAGTIEKRHMNENERAEAGTVLFEIDDTQTLWIQADIRESQWNALGLKAGQQITWSSPALPNESSARRS